MIEFKNYCFMVWMWKSKTTINDQSVIFTIESKDIKCTIESINSKATTVEGNWKFTSSKRKL